MNITPSGQACGARITGLDLSKPLPTNTLQGIRDAWLEHHVLAFPDQRLDDEDLVRVTQALGDVGDDPFFVPINKKTPVVALTRRADEQAPVFAENWHTDWSFKKYPPIGTCLYSLVVPPVGGNTGFANQQLALAQMPDELRNRLEGKVALHSAAAAYGPQGTYGEKDQGNDRSMKILFSEQANKSEPHPIVVKHPESGNDTLFGTVGYIHTIVGLEEDQSQQLIMDLYHWQTREEFQYTHVWEPNTLVVWDNRSVLHRAYGGYDGYARELHRLTIAGSAALSL
ncbi:MAG: taurine dioxygenase [Gammaproteobacteria bacterium]|jgi:taurine dioxygenase|nr:taurine dioxygenase [Gammaproteobacteria bacterium]